MTITTFPPPDPLAWKQADADVHVATRAGEFAGFVEFDGTAFRARDQRGVDRGAFDSLDDARRSLESAGASSARLLRFPFSVYRTLRQRPRRARS